MDDMSKKRTLSDVSDVATHERKSARHDSEYAEVDEQADQAFLSNLQGLAIPDNPDGKMTILCLMLKLLVEFSPHLNQRYAALDHARDLLKDAKLSRELEEAWKNGQFANIRRWEAFRPSGPNRFHKLEAGSNTKEYEVTANAWKEKYRGSSALILEDALTKMNTTRLRSSIYNNILPIVQSSGMGKSRTVDELAKSIFTFPFNLRPIDDPTGFPRPDRAIKTFLESHGENHDDLVFRYLLFFANLFRTAKSELMGWQWDLSDNRSPAAVWRTTLEDKSFRDKYYKQASDISSLKEQYKNVEDAKTAATEAGLELTCQIISMSSGSKGYSPRMPRSPKKQKTDSESVSSGSSTAVTDDPRNRPVRILCYFDESHTLNGESVAAPHDAEVPYRTLYQTLCYSLDQLCNLDMFGIFLSTHSNLASYCPPQRFFWSARGVNAPLIPMQAPFTELPFDVWQKDGRPAIVEGDMSLTDVCKHHVMARFGRPLFWTRLENDAGAFASRLLIEFAQQKLAGSNKIAGNRNAELAALSVRLSLEFEPRRDASREKENSLVEGHMRVAYSVPIHREYMRSGYSSEPILAEAAAEMMKKFDVLAALVDVTSNGLIQKGELGELVGRTLLMRAHDKAIRTEELPQCSSPIPLKAFLVALFGQDATEKIWASEACNIVKSNTFGDEFKDARVHFTHHMRAYRDLTLNDETAYLAMCRGAAWQCAPQHTAVDIGVPVLLRNEKISRRVMTMLWFQIKDRIREGHHIVDVDPEKFFTDPKGDDKRPYIIVIMQLGVKTPKPELTITPPPSRASPRLSHSRHPKFEINVSGCTSNLYNAISASENEQYAQLLAVRDTIEEHSRPETADEVLRLKPFYQSKEASFDWASPKLSALIH